MQTIYHIAIAAGLSLSAAASLSGSSTKSEVSHTLDLPNFEKRVYSQNGEDGVLEKIFEVLGILNEGYYVEFGVHDGTECNTRYFRETYGWNGLLIDNGFENNSINLHKEFITAENINELFDKYNTPEEFDLLSIDIDFNDFHVWKALDSRFSPKVVIIEYNASHLPTEDLVVVYNASTTWDGSNYYGGSLLAFARLGKEKGYSLVNTDKLGVNAIFVRDDLIAGNPSIFSNINNVEALYHAPQYGSGPRGGHTADPQHRCYQDSSGNLIPEPPKW